MEPHDIHSPHNACMHRAGCRQTQATFAALLTEVEALRKDTERLKWLLREECVPDGIVGVECDRYEFAMQAAEAAGRDEPTDADCLDGLRMMIDAAMAAASAVG